MGVEFLFFKGTKKDLLLVRVAELEMYSPMEDRTQGYCVPFLYVGVGGLLHDPLDKVKNRSCVLQTCMF